MTRRCSASAWLILGSSVRGTYLRLLTCLWIPCSAWLGGGRRVSSLGGSSIGGRSLSGEGKIPRDGPSAGLDALGTYLVKISHPCIRSRRWTLLKTSLTSGFRLRPDHQPSTTLLLSPKILNRVLGAASLRIVLTRSSIPTASAQAMSQPSAFHPGASDQALHLSRMVIPIPTLELASEKAWTSTTSFIPGISRVSVGRLSVRSHQRMSLSV